MGASKFSRRCSRGDSLSAHLQAVKASVNVFAWSAVHLVTSPPPMQSHEACTNAAAWQSKSVPAAAEHVDWPRPEVVVSWGGWGQPASFASI